jgi:hypothetical protein
MWKKSLLLLSIEVLSWGFSCLREWLSKENPLARPAEPDPKVVDPIDVLWHHDPDKAIVLPSRNVRGGVELSLNSVWLLYLAWKKGDRSLCDSFGIAPEDVQQALRNEGVLSRPGGGELSSPVTP